MAYPKDLRNQLGITQEAFATLIKCPLGQLAMTETGKRELPVECAPFVSALQIAINAASENPPGPLPVSNQTLAWLNKQIKNAEATKSSLEKQLEDATEKIAVLQTFIQAASLADGNALFDAGNLQGMQLEVLKRKAGEKLQDAQLQIVQLEWSIAGLEGQIVKAKGMREGG